MEGVVDVRAFMAYLQANDLVIAPAAMVRVDKKSLRSQALRKPALTYKEISDSGLWGDISQKRVYQIAKRHARDGEIIKPGSSDNSPEKIITLAAERIAVLRGTIQPHETRGGN